VSVTADATKQCTACREDRPAGMFRTGNARCRECVNARDRARRAGLVEGSGPLLPAGPLQAFIRELVAAGETHATIAAHTSNLGRVMSERQICAIVNERSQVTLDTADRVLLAHGRYLHEFYPLEDED
jgi:hypothetical protein